jgi:hypothetical protein
MIRCGLAARHALAGRNALVAELNRARQGSESAHRANAHDPSGQKMVLRKMLYGASSQFNSLYSLVGPLFTKFDNLHPRSDCTL